MSLPSIFFAADEAVAMGVQLNHALPAVDVAEMSSIDHVKLSTLWAILDRAPWTADLLDAFARLRSTESEWLHRLPDALTRRIASLDGAERSHVAAQWAATEEMQCAPREAEEVLQIIAEVGMRAIQTKRSLYLYTCL